MTPLVESWMRGDGSQAEIAERAGMSKQTFSWWCRRLRSESGPPSRFVAVDVAPERDVEAAAFEVVLGGGRRVRVPRGFDALELSRLLVALEAPC